MTFEEWLKTACFIYHPGQIPAFMELMLKDCWENAYRAGEHAEERHMQKIMEQRRQNEEMRTDRIYLKKGT